MRQPKLDVRDVTMSFGDVVAVSDISLGVSEREFTCIVGTSGGGKTTLLRGMAGLLAPAAGEILFDGQPVTGPMPQIALVFQHFGLFPWKSVRDNVAYGLKVQGRQPRDGLVDGLLETMHLSNFADAYPYQLSGGMKQRVGIARALTVEPQVLLMDEPFSAVDALTRETLQNEVLELWERGSSQTAVLVTHDIDEAILLGDRIVILYGQPGSVTLDLQIPIPRPRDSHQIRSHPEYPQLRRQIWEALQGQQLEREESR